MERVIKFRAYIEDEHRFIFCDDSEENSPGTFFTIVRQIEKISGKKMEVYAIGVEIETGSDMFLDDACRLRLTLQTTLSPLAGLSCQTLR